MAILRSQRDVDHERVANLICTSAELIETSYRRLDAQHLEAAGDVLSYA
jgi:hypothetical protein